MQKPFSEVQQMNPTQLKAYKEGQRDIVFGHDAPKGPKGSRKEQGIGSAAQPSINHVEALRKAEPNNVEAIKKAEADLAAYQKTRVGRMADNPLADL